MYVIIVWFNYRVADVGGRHGFGVVVDVVKLAVDEVVVGALAGADAVIDVVERQHPARRLGHEAHRRVGRHSSLAGAQCGRFTAILSSLISPTKKPSCRRRRRYRSKEKKIRKREIWKNKNEQEISQAEYLKGIAESEQFSTIIAFS